MTQQFTPMYELIWSRFEVWVDARPNYSNPKYAVAGDRVSIMECNGAANPLSLPRQPGFYWVHVCRPRVLYHGLQNGYGNPDTDWEFTYNTNMNPMHATKCGCRYELTERQVILLKLAVLEATVR